MNIEKMSPEFIKDLIELVNSLGNIPKTATVKYGATRFSYVPLDDIMARIKANKNFAFMQPLGKDEGGMPSVQCVLIHSGGEMLISDSFSLPSKTDINPQTFGSLITYAKRYSASAFFGIASDEDNDGQAPEIASPKDMCEKCGSVIVGKNGLSPEKIIAGSKKAYGHMYCYDCSVRAKEERAKAKEDKKEEGNK